jgi:hypothetical protein
MPISTKIAKAAAKKAVKPKRPPMSKRDKEQLILEGALIMPALGAKAAIVASDARRRNATPAKKKSRGPTGVQRFGSKGRK